MQSSELTEYSRWLIQRPVASTVPAYSIAVDINCPACQPSIAGKLARYLDEFGDLPSLSWKAFDSALLTRLAKSPLATQLCSDGADSITHAIAQIGGSVLEGPGVIDHTEGLPYVFQVCLACKEPENKSFHLYLNQKRFDTGKIVSVVADAFLEWVDGGGDPAPSATGAQSLAKDAKPSLG